MNTQELEIRALDNREAVFTPVIEKQWCRMGE